ncbi:MAG: hypothetical protein K0R18_1998 [Bacillales bacterium]|jgi:hypothetical protein|nr:hypothetical protein [Bacillales bacterium]
MIPKIQPIARIQPTNQYKNKKQSEFEKVLEAEKRKCNYGQIKIARNNLISW